VSAPAPDPSDDLRALIDGLGIQEPDVIPVGQLSERALIERYQRVQRELASRGELRDPRTEEGKELHSQHGALLIEMVRRGLRG